MRRTFKHKTANYQKNHGIPGVVYILENPGLRDGLYKIGCSRRSGASRANDLNSEATTGTPGMFKCIFELKTEDCGIAEQKVFQVLAKERRGKWGQEYFEVSFERAKQVIIQVCSEVDSEIRLRHIKPLHRETLQSQVKLESVLHTKTPISLETVLKTTPFGLLANKLWPVIGVMLVLVWLLEGYNKNSIQSANSPTKSPAIATPTFTITKSGSNESLWAIDRKNFDAPNKKDNLPLSKERVPETIETRIQRHPDLSRLSNKDKESIESACSHDKYFNGPAAYDRCLHEQLTELGGVSGRPDLSRLSNQEKESIESACSRDKYFNGPASYNRCLQGQLARIK
ncbi:MAG: GIY-YIG nuclease family protein [Betaproteobacteria bacterium]|nr:GIY-YIG nuclease family protein [Betaproteobacteria bacterium]